MRGGYEDLNKQEILQSLNKTQFYFFSKYLYRPELLQNRVYYFTH